MKSKSIAILILHFVKIISLDIKHNYIGIYIHIVY